MVDALGIIAKRKVQMAGTMLEQVPLLAYCELNYTFEK